MAVIQISKIQVRRGLQENLPQLAGGEFGWSVDERRLWIGNGTLTEGAPEEGNTEILTSRSDVLEAIESYTFKGAESGYTSRTGPNVFSPVKRTLQEKFDDIVNFRDFITAADAASGNYTTALQRAIDQVFPRGYDNEIDAGVRRILKIPAGRWQISNVTVPPYATLQGDGLASTILYGNIALPSVEVHVFEVRDSQGNVGTQVNSLTSRPPGNVTVKGLSIVSTTSDRVVQLESSQNMLFEDVAFIAANTAPYGFLRDGNGVVITSGVDFGYCVGIGDTVFPSRHITFNHCTFKNSQFGLVAQGDSRHITADDCIFENLVVGVEGHGYPCPQIKVTNSYFSNIAEAAIVAKEETSIVSAFNNFGLVGYGDGNTMNSGSSVHPIFFWDSSANYSFADIFERTPAEEENTPIYEITNPGVSTFKSYSASGTLRSTPGFSADIPDGGQLTTEITVGSMQSAIVDYRIYRDDGSTIQSRIGTIKITHTSGNVFFDDEYTETGNIGVSTTFTVTSNKAVLEFDDPVATGYPAYVSYSARSFF